MVAAASFLGRGIAEGADEEVDTIDDEASYRRLVEILQAEERARAKLNGSVEDLRGEVQDLLSRKFPGSRRKLAGSLAGGTKGVAAADDEEASAIVLRPCLCGCGQPRLCGQVGKDSEMDPLTFPWPALSPPECGPADPQAQRAHCELLSRPRVPKEPAVEPKAPSRPLDLARLEVLAQPRVPPPVPEPPPPPPPPRATSSGTAPGRQVRRTASEPCVAGPGARPLVLPPLDGAGRFLSSAAAPRAPAARRLPSKLRPGDADAPGLARLLRAAAAGFPSDEHGGGGGQGVPFSDMLGGGGSPPAWKASLVRTAATQQKYVEARLYRKPAAAAGSLEALQQRLEQLQRERQERERGAGAAEAVPGRATGIRRTASAAA